MANPQTTYLTQQPLYVRGAIADVAYDNIVFSRSAAVAVYVGVIVELGPDGPAAPGCGQCTPIADGASALISPVATIYDSTRQPYVVGPINSLAQYAAQDAVPCLERGRFIGWAEGACAVTDPVYVRVLDATPNVKGQFTNAATTNFIAATGMKFRTSTAAAGLIEVEIK